jgi:quercetin dioxygenase-like cupin family protein
VLGESVVHAEPGDLVHEPRDVWHTFWNAADRPVRFLEIIPRTDSSSSDLNGRVNRLSPGDRRHFSRVPPVD